MPDSKLEQGTTFDSRRIATRLNYVSFDIAYAQLMGWEDPHMSGEVTTDKGGLTRYGISENSHPSLNIRELTAVRAKEITEADYWTYPKWDVPKLPDKNQPLANKLLQFGFNTGVATVIQIANLCLAILQNRPVPKLGDALTVSVLPDIVAGDLLNMLASAQLSRYIVDYHLLSRVPHSLMDRALSIS